MNQSAFDDKLKNFKVVRSADFYKPRSRRTKVTSSTSSSTSGAKAAAKGKEAGGAKAAKSTGVFGEIEALCENSLTPAELSKFMNNLRAVHKTAARRVNLNDLETLCST